MYGGKRFLFLPPLRFESWHPNDDEYLPLDEATGSDWFAAAWCNTEKKIAAFRNVFPHGMDKTIVFGHWGTSQLYENIDGVKLDQTNYGKIWKNAGHINMLMIQSENIEMNKNEVIALIGLQSL